ncbi:M14 family zinc carboxypeptidase [Dyadobacter sandarakinus]|uniref:Zinc carboxypeptidase n=1 Tax=Dyadobacter sandarakinus TaxID=2747268 RepID=A0ABX7IC59_9BACT|nr:M14 family zinc carboxypeptidase [Dyadobacter sandarakinus]QRR03699.1 zinc carboxypeptidase [Dyadobacter sandarakinus]
MLRVIRIILFLTITHQTFAQTSSPEQFLGYPLGAKFTFHSQIIDYFRLVQSQNPGQMKLVQYGSTNEGRPLMLAFISSAENISKLETIRTNHLKSIGMLEGKPDASVPPIVWLSYNVHGNESVSANVSMQVIFELLNKQNALTQDFLKNMVILIDPCINPDGYERYTQWYNRVQNAIPDATPFGLEHDEPWPGGRFNHYLFDLNRDWAWQTQKETRERIVVYNQWMPHFHADFHEMGPSRSYYFPPAAKPYHKDITAWQRQFNNLIGEYCRKYFDKNNWAYFTRYNYDLFYPSYGDTWPTMNGAIGVTYEQGGGGRAGLGIERKDENDTLTLKNRIDHHYATSLATLEAVLSQKEKVVSEFIKFHADAATAPAGVFKSYIVKTKGSEERVRYFAEWLGRQGITFGVAGKSISTRGTDLVNVSEEALKIESNDLLISAYQPKSNLLRVLFEPRPVLEDSVTYDVTSWGLGYIFGLKAYGVKEKLVPAAYQPVKVENTPSAAPVYAYLARWSEVEDARFLAELLRNRLLVKTSNVPFETDKITFDAGTLVITKKGNERPDFDKVVTAIANKHHVKLTPVATGFVTSGADFGDDHVASMTAPKVVAVSGNGISPTSFGAVWHYFEQQIQYPLTIVDGSRLASLPWNEIDVLILPDGRYSDLLGDKQLDALQSWIRNGGRLIAMERATDAFIGKGAFALSRKTSDKKKDENPLRKYADQEREEAGETSPGSMFMVNMDATHPLAFGCSKEYVTLVRDAYERDYLKDGWNVGYLAENNYRAGFVGAKMAGKLKNTLIFGVQELGRGKVIYMMDDPVFRSMLYNGQVLFSNAVFR